MDEQLNECDFIGAIGINIANKSENQEEIFSFFLSKAIEQGKKALIIDASAADRILEIMKSQNVKGHIVRTNQWDRIQDYIELDSYLIIIPSIYVYEEDAEIVATIPAENILTALESYNTLAWAGIFEPGDIALDQMLETISEIKGMDKHKLKRQVYENYLALGI